MASAADQLFAKIALHNKLVSREQVQQAMGEQQRLSPDRPLADILLEHGYINPAQRRKLQEATDRMGAQATPNGRVQAPPELETRRVPARPGEPVRERAPAEARGSKVSERSERTPIDSLGSAQPTPGQGIEAFLSYAREQGASDLHLCAGDPPFIRRHGIIQYLDHPPLAPPEAQQLVSALLTPQQRSHLAKHLDLDLCVEPPGLGRFRANFYKRIQGFAACFRVIAERVPTLAELGLPQELERFTHYQQGIVLVTGPAGCGKSSTMAALIEIVNASRKDHIITVEDPIEYRFESKLANVSQRQIEAHTKGWSIALRSALREDPDVIMIGEMRDLETISTAITAAETGHLVLGTLHTTSAIRSVDRVLDVFPPKEQPQIRAMVSESLRGVISQVLVPKAGGGGRVAACEIMFNTPAIGHLIREAQTFKMLNIMQTGKKQGQRLLDDGLVELLQARKITKETAKYYAQVPSRFD